MTTRSLLLVPAVLLVALLVALLTSCGASPAAPAAPVGAAALPTTRQQPDPLTAAEREFIDQVRVIAPPLAEHPERLARRGGNTCDRLETDGIVDETVERFSGGSYTVTTEQAEEIIAAAEETVCADQ